jgi:hypothetical protein
MLLVGPVSKHVAMEGNAPESQHTGYRYRNTLLNPILARFSIPINGCTRSLLIRVKAYPRRTAMELITIFCQQCWYIHLPAGCCECNRVVMPAPIFPI